MKGMNKMGNLHDWMRDEARQTAVKLSGINSNEVLRGAAGGFGMRQRVNALLDTVKAAMFPSLYETGAVSHTHLTALAEEHRFQRSPGWIQLHVWSDRSSHDIHLQDF